MPITPAAVRFRLILAALLPTAACGARAELESPAIDAGTSSAPPAPTSPPDCSDAGPPPPAAACAPLDLHLSVAAACSIARPTCAPVDAEGFVSVPTCPGCGVDNCGAAEPAPERVFVMNRLGKGHVIGWCDSTNLVSLTGELNVAGYLGQSAAPRVASVGLYPCEFEDSLAGATHLGPTLPAEYADGAALAADWDVLVACGAGADFGDAFGPAVLSFVRDHGRGLLAVFDYVCGGNTPAPALDQMNAVTSQAGFVFEAVNLGYGSGDLASACVADYLP